MPLMIICMGLEAPLMKRPEAEDPAVKTDKAIATMLKMLSIDFRPGVTSTVRELALQGELRKLLKPEGFTPVATLLDKPSEVEAFEAKLSPQDLRSFQTVYWRGAAPESLLKSILNETPIELAPGFYNMAEDYKISISYSGLEAGGSEAPFNMCLGFKPDHVHVADRFVPGKAKASAGNDDAVAAGLARVQEGMMEGHGRIEPDDIEWIIARPHSGQPGVPGRMLIFKRKPLAEEGKKAA